MAQPPPDHDIVAVRLALGLVAAPSRRRMLRNTPLPEGVVVLLRIAADDLATIEMISQRTRTPPQKLREAAAFFIEQILLAASADSYRVLGARRSATATELRRNLTLLCKWLQSESGHNMAQPQFFLRVTRAWNNLKTPERRAEYDATLNARTAAVYVKRISGSKTVQGDWRGSRGLKSSSDVLSERGRHVRLDSIGLGGNVSIWRRLLTFVLGPRPY